MTEALHQSTVCPPALLTGMGHHGHLRMLDASNMAAASGLQHPAVRGEVARDAWPTPPGLCRLCVLLRTNETLLYVRWFSALACADPGKSCAAVVLSSSHDAAVVVPHHPKLGQWPAGDVAEQGEMVASACWTTTDG